MQSKGLSRVFSNTRVQKHQFFGSQSCPTVCSLVDCSPTRLLCPWDSPGQNTGVGCHTLLRGIIPTQGSNPCLLHWQADSLPPSHLGSPKLAGDQTSVNQPSGELLTENALIQFILINSFLLNKGNSFHQELCLNPPPPPPSFPLTLQISS